jgi:hypothetical protein
MQLCKVLPIILFVMAIEGCGSGGGADAILCGGECPPLSSSGGSGSGGGTSGAGGITYLDCENLNPERMYVYGKLNRGTDQFYALADPSDLNFFCVAFPTTAERGMVSRSGKYVYHGSGGTKQLTQDALLAGTSTSFVRWAYPRNPVINDIEFNVSSEPYHSRNGSLETVLAVFPNGSTLEYSSVVADDLKLALGSSSTLIVKPAGAGSTPFYHTAKIVPNSGDSQVWVVVDTFPPRRWRIDLNTLTATDEGEFSELPFNTIGGSQFILDGEGDLWQIGSDTDVSAGETIKVIIKRPILSSGVSATVVTAQESDDESWDQKSTPDVRLIGAVLITGR